MTSWTSAARVLKRSAELSFIRPDTVSATVDWNRLVTIDFETYFDADYTLKKLSTSEYVRDPHFKAQMCSIKIGKKPVKVYTGWAIKSALQAINWSTHSLLCHHTQFDGLILSHHYKVKPLKYYCTMSMARGLHSNEIGGGLDEVAKFYGGEGKIDGVLELTRGVLNWDKELIAKVKPYCAQDNEECFRIFEQMHPTFPSDEMELVDLTVRMFCDPVLKVDIPRVEAELKRELDRREQLFYTTLDPKPYYDDKKVLKTKAERELIGVERDMLIIKRVIGSNEKFMALLKAEGIEPPVKISPAWMKLSQADAAEGWASKWIPAFAKDDMEFIGLPDDVDAWRGKLNQNKKKDIPAIVAKQARVQTLVDCRLAVKSTTNITRAQRFLVAGAKGMSLPCYYAYFRAHTGRWGGGDKNNLQNLMRGGELRASIEAPKGHVLCVADSGQIEARVNGYLWGQQDLLRAFQDTDNGIGVDAYCRFATTIYGRPITKADKTERFVGKVCVLGLGFQMGPAKLQMTLARGALGGPPVYFTLVECEAIVRKYRRMNDCIQEGWTKCGDIIKDMAEGRTGSYKCITWEANKIWLPNGLSLKYPELRLARNEKGWDEWTYQSGDHRSKLYGGLLCENVVQALARIIVGQQMLEISKQYRVVMTTHDEAVALAKASQADRAMAFMLQCMKTAPAWCRDIPLSAEGGYATNYSK